MGIFSKLVTVSLAAASLVKGDGMNARAKLSGKYMGIELSPNEVSDSAFMAIVDNIQEVGSLVPGNAMKWDATEGSRNVFSYKDADATVARAQKNGQIMRCHTLVWHNQIPSWVKNGGFNNATLISVMKNHITNVVTHFKGKCYAWDVVNEALNEDGSLRTSIFSQVIGEAFIPIAFAAAAAADPDAKLYYNDYNTDRAGAKSTGAQNIVKMVKRYGAKIDGVGCQAHLSAGQSPSLAQLQANLEGFTNLGVDVAYTELDIGISGTPTSTTLQKQAVDYGNIVTACKNVARCVGITMWGLTDKYTWRQNDSPLPFDRQLQKKPAYTAILNAWGTGGGGQQSTTTTARATTAGATTRPTTMATTTRNTGSGGSVPQYGQCGGNGWTGGTSCVSPYTCKFTNEWYSQCL